MGFGLLMIGYFTATMMSFNVLGGIFRLMGYILVCVAAKKLSQYNNGFFFLLAWSIVMVPFSAGAALSDLSAFLNNNLIITTPLVSKVITDILTNTRIIFDFIFTTVLCFTVRGIAKETGATKIVYKSVRNYIYFCIFCAFQFTVWLASVIGIPAFSAFVKMTALSIWTAFLSIICSILISLMLFSCYATICDANDVEMRVKPSRFEFINRRREQKEQRSQDYIEEAKKYSAEQQARTAVAEKSKKKK